MSPSFEGGVMVDRSHNLSPLLCGAGVINEPATLLGPVLVSLVLWSNPVT